jgi:glutamate-1-semialdehyde 2,1-aminomutase
MIRVHGKQEIEKENNMILAVIQARMSSTRLPGKVMKDILGKPMIVHMLERVKRSRYIDKIVLATSINPDNDVMEKMLVQSGNNVFRGNEHDVLDRYYQAALAYHPDVVVRLTGDCPLIDHAIIDNVIEHFISNKYDYVSNIDPPTFPDGLDTEVFSFKALEVAWRDTTLKYDREHVTTYIRNSKIFSKANVSNKTDLSKERWTVDDPADFELVKNIFEDLLPVSQDFTMEDVLNYKKQNPAIFNINSGTKRNEGMSISSGQKLWKKAKNVIAGGNSLLSKRPDMFLPEFWPSYFEKSKGIEVWDLDGNKYIDMTIMGIGTNVLGYANDEIDNKVIDTIRKGTTSTLNCPEEVALADKLIELHPWAEMVRYTRSGGEACAMAIRIARAASGKDGVAFCGYHGWHDWYLSANLADDKSLDGQLLPGLEPRGVPRGLKGNVIPFMYNDIESFRNIISNNDIGTIIMEPVRNHEPAKGFLEEIRSVASQKNIVLIFDEITSGFRRELGGIHKSYNVYPDMAVLGKALGNGYPIGTVIGKKSVMDYVQSTFISSTNWTERIGPVAALATIEIMQRDNIPMLIDEMGKYVSLCWKQLGIKCGLPITIEGIPALTHFSFDNQNNQLIKTFITQEMLKKGYLATNSLYVCRLHTKDVVDKYIEILEPVFLKIKKGIENGNLASFLNGPICQSGFKRLI